MNREQSKAIGFAVLLGILGYMIYMGWGRSPAFFAQRPYERCPEGTQLFESDTFGYTLCLPGRWSGRYVTENRDKTISFLHAIPNQRTFLFSITSVPEAFWMESEDIRKNMQYIGRDDGRVFAAVLTDYIPQNQPEITSFFGDVPGILRTISFSPNKSIERVMEDHFNSKVAIRSKNGKLFTATELLGRDEENGRFKYYVWVHTQEFLFRNGALEKGYTMNMPGLFVVQPQPTGYSVAGFQAPRGGEFFKEDLASLFPERIVQSEWFNPDLVYHNEHVAILANIARSRARAEFGIKAERKMGYITTVTAEEGVNKVTFDPVFWLMGPEAVVAMRAEGACEPLGPCELTNNYYISNPDKTAETYEVALGPEVLIQPQEKVPYAQFLEKFLNDPAYYEKAPFYFEIENGKIVKIAEQYRP